MSDLRDVLRDVLAGGGADARAVLHNCRFDGAGASSYGREAILELFRAETPAVEYLQVVGGRRFGALFACAARGSVALFADLYGEHIARLWYLAATPLPSPRPERVDVPFDPTLGQPASSVAFDPVDHPELAPAHVSRVVATAARLVETRTVADATPLKSAARLTRLRPYVLRAFSHGEATAVLIVVVALRSDGRPGLVQFPIAALLPSDLSADATVVVDEGECEAELARTWRPVL